MVEVEGQDGKSAPGGRRTRRGLAENWVKLEPDRAAAMTGKPLPAPGVFRHCLGHLASPWHALDSPGVVLRNQSPSLLAWLTSGETVPAV